MTSKRRKKTPGKRDAEGERRVEVPVEGPDDIGDDVEEAPVVDEGVPAPEGETEPKTTPGVVETADASLLEAEKRAADLEDRLRRVQAEYANETKRIARQAEEGRKYAIEGLARDLLPVFDALHGAGQSLANAGDAVREGFDLVEKELLKVLGRHGVERIEAQGQPFDPSLHEALYVVADPELEPNTVAQVLRPGFTLHGRVVRAAHVAVTKADEPAEGGEDETSSPGEGE